MKEQQYECPVCHYVTNINTGALVISIEPYDGQYCIKCWAKTISENTPKLIPYDQKNIP